MKHYLKRMLSVILALALYFSCLPLTFAAEPSYTRIYGANRYETAFAAANALKDKRNVEKFPNIVIASGKGFADALAGSYLAAKKDAPILLVNSNFIEKTAAYIKGNLISGGTVYLLGGEAAIPSQMEAALTGYTVKRLAGSNRYETNLKILEETGVGDDEILIATGKGFADSLSASAVGKPILLVGKSLNDAQKALLSKCSGKFVIIGGESAVNKAVEETLKTMGTVTRLGGSNRYETSVLVAKRFFQTPTTAVLAYAKNFPDGLCGGPLAYAMGAPLILTATGSEAQAAAYTAEKGITSGYVLGGAGLISDNSCQMIFGSETEPPHSHSYGKSVTEPTCEAKGYTTYTCSCGDSYKADETAATGHSWGSWKTTVEATTDANGEEARTCGACGKSETRKTDKLPAQDAGCTEHAWGDWTSDNSGSVRSCTKCGQKHVINGSNASVSQEVVNLINAERAAAGLPALSWYSAGEACARIRAEECANVWGHNRPDGTPNSNFVSGYGIWGECLTGGASASVAVSNWMASDGHRPSLLAEYFTSAVAAYCNGVWVVLFA